MMQINWLIVVVLVCLPTLAGTVLGWSDAHRAITAAAFDALPVEQRALWQTGTPPISEALIDDYCYYPDHYDCGPKNPSFRPQVKPYIYFEGEQSYHYFTMSRPQGIQLAARGAKWYVERIVAAMRDDRVDDAAQYAGAWAHAIEDRVSPYHCLDGYESQRHAYEREHGVTFEFWALEDRGVRVLLDGYKPRLLGVDATQVAENFAPRFVEINRMARELMPEYIAAHLKDDYQARTSGPATDAVMSRMAEPAAQLIVDVWYTCFMIAAGEARAGDVDAHLPPVKFSDGPYQPPSQRTDLRFTVPLEVTNPGAEQPLVEARMFTYTSPGTTGRFDRVRDVVRSGSYAFHTVNHGPSSALWAITVDVKPNAIIRAAAWCRTRQVDEAAVALRFKDSSGSYIEGVVEEVTKLSGTHDWSQLVTFADVPPDAVAVDVFLIVRNGNDGAEAWFDDVALTAVKQ